MDGRTGPKTDRSIGTGCRLEWDRVEPSGYPACCRWHFQWPKRYRSMNLWRGSAAI